MASGINLLHSKEGEYGEDNHEDELYGICQSILGDIINALNKHILLSKKRKEEKVHKCEICYKVFKMNWMKARHVLTHKPKSDYTCNICRQKYDSKENLDKHDCTQKLSENTKSNKNVDQKRSPKQMRTMMTRNLRGAQDSSGSLESASVSGPSEQNVERTQKQQRDNLISVAKQNTNINDCKSMKKSFVQIKEIRTANQN